MLPTTCPHCSRQYRVEAKPGESVKCPGCGKFAEMTVDHYRVAQMEATKTRLLVRSTSAGVILVLVLLSLTYYHPMWIRDTLAFIDGLIR